MSYSQWKSVDRTTLQTHSADLDDFIELLVHSVDNLTTCSFIAKSQAHHLTQRKEEITGSECIILFNFAENYHFVVQDKIQGYHFIFSDDLEHDTCFVHELQRIIMLYIKENLSQIKSVDYFSDGCAGLHKNSKAFLTLCTLSQISTLIQHGHFLQHAIGYLPETELAALSNARYFMPVCRDLLMIKSWCSVQSKCTANHS